MAPLPSPHSAPSTAASARISSSPFVFRNVPLRLPPKSSRTSCCALSCSQHGTQTCSVPGTHWMVSRRNMSCRCVSIGTAVEPGWKDADFIEVGTLGRPHGVRGEVVVSIDTSFPEERFASPGVRYFSQFIDSWFSCMRCTCAGILSCSCAICFTSLLLST